MLARQLPALRPREVIGALDRGGFSLVRVKGSHNYFVSGPELLVYVSVHPGDLKRLVLRSVIRRAGLTVDEFLALR